MRDMAEPITPTHFHESEGTEDWRVVGEGACAWFVAPSLADGARLATAICGLAGLDAHHPDLDLRHDGVLVRLLSTADGRYGLTDRDLDLAREISVIARDLGLGADPSLVQTVQLTLDAAVTDRVLPFWRAVLGYADRGDGTGEDLVDPRGRGPALRFRHMEPPRQQRSRLHVDLWVPYDEAEQRIVDALQAGGHLVSDEHAPMWWTLADAEGNEVDIATTSARD